MTPPISIHKEIWLPAVSYWIWKLKIQKGTTSENPQDFNIYFNQWTKNNKTTYSCHLHSKSFFSIGMYIYAGYCGMWISSTFPWSDQIQRLTNMYFLTTQYAFWGEKKFSTFACSSKAILCRLSHVCCILAISPSTVCSRLFIL